MGGSSKKVTVGYKYYLGMHMILCHGPIDRITHIRIDDRVAWEGATSGGPISIQADGLFGGESREGGVSGHVDIEMGRPDQGVNPYLSSRISPDMPAFRGVVGAVLRHCYLGMNPYLKRWAFRGTRIMVRQDGLTQWYPERAGIGVGAGQVLSNSSLLISMDLSGSMAGTKLTVLKAAMAIALNELQSIVASGAIGLNIKLVGWESTVKGVIQRDNVSVGDFADLQAFVAAMTTSGGTSAVAAYQEAIGYFNPSIPRNNVLVCVSDGAMSNIATALAMGIDDMVDDQNPPFDVFTGTAVKMRGVGIQTAGSLASFDNSGGAIPVVAGDNPEELAAVILAALQTSVPIGDMNPAHIIRECLTDPDWGMGYQESDIDEASFRAAADTLAFEGMGISILWDRQMPMEDFVTEIIKHISASLYVSRDTGLFVLKLIRGNYIRDDLMVLDEDHITRVDNATRPTMGELVNSITVNYWNSKAGDKASVTVQDQALIQMQGAVINTTMQFPGFTNIDVASRVALRSMTSLSTPLLSCTVYADRTASHLNVGDVFRMTWPDLEVYDLVMRVMQIALGDGKSNAVKLTVIEDAFSYPAVATVVPPDNEWVEPGGPPEPAPSQVAFEAPYYELVQSSGQTTVDEQLAANENLGYLQAAATAPPGAINAVMSVDAGAGFEDNAALDFCPGATLAEPVDRMATNWLITNVVNAELITLGQHAQIGQELVRIDDIDPIGGTMTVGRAVLDTTPRNHAAGARLLFWDEYAAADLTEYVDGEVLQVRVRPTTGQGTLPLESATSMSVTMQSRAARPYPPANIRLNGQYFPVDPVASLVLNWDHRNRRQQTGGVLLAWTDGSITPEAGLTYRVIVEDELGVVVHEQAGITANLYTVPSGDLPVTSEFGFVTIIAERDGLQSLFNLRTQFFMPQSEGGDLLFVMDDTIDPPDGDNITFVME